VTFQALGLSPQTLAGVQRAGFTEPTPIQRAAIPVVLTGKDLIGCAETGTGKTAAFVLPIIDKMRAKPSTRALVLAPTRELAIQIASAVETLGGAKPPTIAIVLGGVSMGPQISALGRRPAFVIATPGRLNDHLGRGTAKLEGVSILVLDEADRMLDMGFLPQIERILERIPSERQTLLFSATMPTPKDPLWRSILSVGLRSPERISIDRPRVARKAEQALWKVDQEAKTPVLLDLLDAEQGSVLVFTRTKHRADRVARQLKTAGHRADRIHGDRTQGQREKALESFRAGRVRVLVATDIAARGIDVEGVAHVVNYDLPADPEDYVHRVGRTARAERTGKATSFVLPSEQATIRAIERLTKERLPHLVQKHAEKRSA
jgi:ATP-dependent RNA helicase RhlE